MQEKWGSPNVQASEIIPAKIPLTSWRKKLSMAYSLGVLVEISKMRQWIEGKLSRHILYKWVCWVNNFKCYHFLHEK